MVLLAGLAKHPLAREPAHLANGNIVMIGLVEKGAGTLKPYLIRQMISQLRENGLVPPDLESP
jgi:hypothetical protein